MAVDIGRLIAESVDGYYKKSVHYRDWAERHNARWAAIVESLKNGTFTILAESFGGLSEALPDERRNDPKGTEGSDSHEYRKGYQAGWVRKHREVKKGVEGDGKVPEDHGGSRHYGDGFADGYKASGPAQNLLAMHKSGDYQGAGDLAQSMNVPHLGPIYQKHSNSQQGDEALQTWDKSRTNKAGEPTHTFSANDAASIIDAANKGLYHPADYGTSLARKFSARVQDAGNVQKRQAGEEGGQDMSDEGGGRLAAVAQSREPDPSQGMDDREQAALRANAPTPPQSWAPTRRSAAVAAAQSAPSARRDAAAARIAARRAAAAATQGDAPQPQSAAPQSPATIGGEKVDLAKLAAISPEKAQWAVDQHQKAMADLESALYGPDSVAAHDAGQHHQGVADFRAQGFTPGSYHKAIEHANEQWKGQMVSALKQSQADGNTDLARRSYPAVAPIPGDPHGRLGYIRQDDGSVVDPSTFKYNEKTHKNVLVHHDFDPVQVLTASLNDPRGFGAKGEDQPDDDKTGAEKYGQEAVDVHDARAAPGVYDTSDFETHEAAKNKAKKIGQTDPAMMAKMGYRQDIEDHRAERKAQGASHEHHHAGIAEHRKARADRANVGWGVKGTRAIPGFENYTQVRRATGKGPKKSIDPNAGRISRILDRAGTAFHEARDSSGRLMAGTETTDPATGEPVIHGDHPMLEYHRGHVDIQKELNSGTHPDNLQALEKLSLKAQGRVKGAQSAAQNPNLHRATPEGQNRYGGEGGTRGAGYIRKKALGAAIEFVMGVVEKWLQENVEVPEGRLELAMEEIYSRIRPTYGHLFEVEGS